MTTYRQSGVDQEAADALVSRFAAHAARTSRSEVISGPGGFAGLFALDRIIASGRAGRPTLAMSTDTVGTKIELLARAGRHRTAGWDAVAMNVDDLVCCGAEPLLFVDCIAIERLDPAVAEEIVAGVADGCVEAGCALIGGETAQLPGLLTPGGYEVVGTAVGVVDADRMWGPGRVRAGDGVVGLASSGPHSNGYSLIRKLLSPDEEVPEALLAPTEIYARRLLAAADGIDVHAAAHITGGGLADNLARVLPAGLGATLHRSRWPEPPVFSWIASRGVEAAEMERVFNLGLGMCLITPQPADLVAALQDQGVPAFEVGAVEESSTVRLV